jgi:hypothetical protein
LRFHYPLYSLLFFLPFALLEDYVLARAFWMTALEIALVLLIGSGLRLVAWRPRTPVLIALLFFILLGVHTVIPVLSGNFAVGIALLITLAFSAIKSKMDALAGFLLALSTIMPQLVIVWILFTLIWSISNQRWSLVVWFIGGWALLAVGSSLLLSDWIIQYKDALLYYYNLEMVASPGQALQARWPGLGAQMGGALTSVLLMILAVEWWLAYGKGFHWYLWTSCLTLVIGQLVGFRTDPGSLVVLMFPVLLVFSVWDEHWGSRKGWLQGLLLLFLFAGSWWMVLRSVDSIFFALAPPVLFFMLPFVLLAGLYWVRWRVVRPHRFYLNEMRAPEEF